MNAVINCGFTDLTDPEWVVRRVSQTASIPLIAHIGDGFGGPLAVSRGSKTLFPRSTKTVLRRPVNRTASPNGGTSCYLVASGLCGLAP